MTNKIFPKKRKIAILGSMLELGESSSIEHQSISSQIKANKFDQLYAYGDHSDDYVKNLDLSTVFIRLYDHSEIKKYIDLNSLDNTVILVKGSRGMKMEKIFNFLGL
jgi:UDP-N-acetylmuramoyl-tripeptide--D-alanyl-D-alanine ligase